MTIAVPLRIDSSRRRSREEEQAEERLLLAAAAPGQPASKLPSSGARRRLVQGGLLESKRAPRGREALWARTALGEQRAAALLSRGSK